MASLRRPAGYRPRFLGGQQVPRTISATSERSESAHLVDSERYTMPLGLKALLDQFGQGGVSLWEIVMAASVIVTIPMVVIVFLGQRHFVQGISTTGTKG
ncbi:MAG: hypothetical protein H0W51_10155 [Euzebyales bacterium]|nr:hypothetical protein [Euzebyales bacterium]